MAGAPGSPSLGVSLELADGDLAYDTLRGDLRLVTDQPALAQALELAIETQLGSDLMNATFGFDRTSIGAYAFALHTRKEYVKMQLVRCVTADRRVRDVRDIFFEDDARYFELHNLPPAVQQQIVAQARASREYTVYVLVDTIADDALSLQSEMSLG